MEKFLTRLNSLFTTIPVIISVVILILIFIGFSIPKNDLVSTEKQHWEKTIADSNVDYSRIIFREFEDKLKGLNDKLVSESLITKKDLSDCRSTWEGYLQYKISKDIKSKNIKEQDILDFIRGGDLSDYNLKKIENDELEYLMELQVLNRQVTDKINTMQKDFNKSFAEKISNYIKNNGDDAFLQLKSDLQTGKKTSEEVWEILKNSH